MTKLRKKLAGLVLVGVVPLAVLTGCSNASDTTCDEYAASDNPTSIERSLLREHDLSVSSGTNIVGVHNAIVAYCGIEGIASLGQPLKATKNNRSSLENVANWSSEYW